MCVIESKKRKKNCENKCRNVKFLFQLAENGVGLISMVA